MSTSTLTEVERTRALTLFLAMEQAKGYLELDRGTQREKCIYFDDDAEEEREITEPWVATKRVSGMTKPQHQRFSQFGDAFAWVMQQ